MIPGGTLLLLGLLGLLASAHFKGLRYFDRPAPARHPWFDAALDVLKWALLVAGLVLIARASLRVFLSAAGLLLALWGYRRFIRTAFFLEKLLRRDFTALRRDRPDLSD